MIWSIIENQVDNDTKKHAGGKAREDINNILTDMGYRRIEINAPQAERKDAGVIRKLQFHKEIAGIWNDALAEVGSGDTVIFQFPVVNHTYYLRSVIKRLKKRDVKAICIIHDLDMLRFGNNSEFSLSERFRINKEELDQIVLFDRMIVHNKSMNALLSERFGISADKMIDLEIFDYLTDVDVSSNEEKNRNESACIIAGNLNKSKSGYVYNLPGKPDFALYGINYEAEEKDNIRYYGSFLADELPRHLKGKYGLVWDGDSIETCSGRWGEYMKINNPHKTSLYLASGLPVIVWSDAAVADFVNKEGVGFTVDKLSDIQDKMDNMDERQYNRYLENVRKISARLQTGWYTKKAVEAAVKGL